MKAIPWLYHISPDGKLPAKFIPRLPAGSEEKNQGVFKEFNVPRVSFSPCVFRCLQAIIPNVYEQLFSEEGQKNGCEFYVYRMKSGQNVRIKTPEELTKEHLVWDAHITHEHCVLDPVEVINCGKVNARVDKSDPGLTIYPYNDHSLKPVKNKLCEDAKFKLLQRPENDEHRILLFGQRSDDVGIESLPVCPTWYDWAMEGRTTI
jgi:hypothetical protein